MDHAWSLLNVDESFDYTPHRSMMTQLMLPPERPPAVLNAEEEVPHYTEAQGLIAEARARLDKLIADREQIKLAVIATEEARTALTRKVAKGERINLGQAEKIAIERAGHEQALDLIEDAIKAAEQEYQDARAWFRKILRHTGHEIIQILVRQSNEADAEIRRIKQRSEALAAWAQEIQTGLNGNPSEYDLQRLLGI